MGTVLRRVVGLLIFLLGANCSEPAPAEPSTEGTSTASNATAPTLDWIEPGGRYGLTFVGQGWQRRSDQRPTSIIEIVPTANWGNDAYCALWEDRRLPPRSTQAQLNAATDRQTRATAVTANIQSNDLALWHDQVDGISTAELRFHDATTYQRWRIFRLSTSRGNVQINLVCGSRLPITSDQESELEAIVTSLRFVPGAPP